MQRRRKFTVTLIATGVVIAIAATGALALTGSSAKAQTVVKNGHALGKTVLVTRQGRTLYSLSAERNGRFICTGSCLSLWKPLVVSKGTRPAGAAKLSTIRRPDGRTQVTYQGKPLYTFVKDTKSGQASGEGFKDVGTWHVASVGKSASTAPKQMTTTTSPGGYGY